MGSGKDTPPLPTPSFPCNSFRMRWTVERSEIAYRCRIFDVRRDQSRSQDSGKSHEFHVLEVRDWVNVVPITPDRHVILVRQFRHGIRDLTLEVPAGILDETDATPAIGAARELREETGYAAPSITPLGVVHPNPAIMNNRCHIFVAREARLAGAQALDGTEEVTVESVALAAIPELIRNGTISNALTLVAFQLLHLHHPDVW